jgi:hypothetical protein
MVPCLGGECRKEAGGDADLASFKTCSCFTGEDQDVPPATLLALCYVAHLAELDAIAKKTSVDVNMLRMLLRLACNLKVLPSIPSLFIDSILPSPSRTSCVPFRSFLFVRPFFRSVPFLLTFLNNYLLQLPSFLPSVLPSSTPILPTFQFRQV